MTEPDPADFRIDVYRGDGIAVRVTHMPTGIHATVSRHAGQVRNEAEAMGRVLQMVEDQQQRGTRRLAE